MSRQTESASLARDAAPTVVRAFDGLPAASAHAVAHWIDALAALPLEDWIIAGQACVDQSAARQRDAAAQHLMSILSDHQLALTAWFIRDLVATAAFTATAAASHASRDARRDLAAARAAADWAALAIAAEAWLPRAERDALCAPFHGVIADRALRLV